MSLTNEYFSATRPFEAFINRGCTESNTYIGRSQAMATVYSREQVVPGDEVHDLAGGAFLVRDGALVGELRFRLPEKSVLERGPDRDVRPDDALAPLASPTKPGSYYRGDIPVMDLAWVRANAASHGRGPVYVLA